jgi:hypothetical protein
VIAGADKAAATAAEAAKGKSKPHKKGDFVFTPEEIAREGAHGIDQTNYPNCWFESAMSALAQLPRGQKLMARMITYGDNDSYVVRFPGDGVEYKITEAELKESGVECKAKWASLLDYAERKKFPDNIGSNGADGDQSRLQVGLGCITGCTAEHISPYQASNQELSSFIYGAVSSQNPITAGTVGRSSVPLPVVTQHAYTIIGFEPARNMVILRNPHGKNGKKFKVINDPQHLHFEQLDDGVFKMNLDYFRVCFSWVCRSFI